MRFDVRWAKSPSAATAKYRFSEGDFAHAVRQALDRVGNAPVPPVHRSTSLRRRIAHPTVARMISLECIKRAISELSFTELDRFREWFETFDAQRFDERIEQDAQAGKLDRIADEALAEHRTGRTREL